MAGAAGRSMVANALGWAAIWLLSLLVLGAVAFPLMHRLDARFAESGRRDEPGARSAARLVRRLAAGIASSDAVWAGRAARSRWRLIALLSAWSEMASRRRGAPLAAATRRSDRGVRRRCSLIVFACFFWLRGFYPDVRSTEKPMEIGFLTSTMHARWMPPNDAWLSGYTINYYYFGYVETAALGLLGGVRPEVSFNMMSITLPGAHLLRREWHRL